MPSLPMTALAFSLLIFSQLNEKKAEELFKANNSFTAVVKAVPQGDLISVDLEKELISIRLAEIDSPDPRQPFSQQAQRFTEDLTLNQMVTVIVKFVDKFQRVVADVELPDGRSLNAEVVRWGYAWHYKVTPRENPFVAQMEYEAWKKHLGLWMDENPIPPWKFRAESITPPPPSSPNSIDYDRIFEYGIFGDKVKKVYSWPACRDYAIPPKENRILFASKLGAESLGYRARRLCPKK